MTGWVDEECARIRLELERALAKICPSLPANDRDDVIQAAHLRLLKIQQKSEGVCEFNASYLWRVAYSALVDETRRRRRRREDPLEEGVFETTVHAHGNPERETASRQTGRAIRGCLQMLVRARRLAVVLYLQGHGVPESARLLGWKRKKVENLVYRGLADLRKCLATKGMTP